MTGASLSVALALAAAPAFSAPAALATLASDLASQAAVAADPASTVVTLSVEAPSPLGPALSAALDQALRARGFRAVVLEPSGADARLFVRAGLDRGELLAAGELTGLRSNFFTGQPAVAPAAISARAAIDPATRLLLGVTPAGPGAIRVTQFAELPEAPLAIAAGDLDGPAVAALTPLAVYVFRAGARLRFPLPAATIPAHPAREPAGGVVIAGGRVLWALPAAGVGGVLRLEGGALRADGELPQGRVPLAAGPAGVLTAAAQPGRSSFEAALLLSARIEDPAPRAGVAPGPVRAAVAGRRTSAFLVQIGAGVVPLGPDLAPSGPALGPLGSGFAAADLLGDGSPLLVTTSPSATLPDSIRVLPLEGGAPRFEATVPDVLWTGAAYDLDGDGREDVVLAGRGPGTGGVIVEVHAP